ncbi:MAG TPA: hypothetical protein VKV77_00425 [Methylovirgula sp.]|nr:hypothetical protein [Methylovirgula sp.]
MTSLRISLILAAAVLGGPAALADSASYNPLADRAATLGGTAFTMERAEGIGYRAPNRGLDGRSVRAFGNPLADRAATLGGRAFVVERTEAIPYKTHGHRSASSAQPAANPFDDRVATLAGRAFTVERQGAPGAAPGAFVAIFH